MVGIGAALFVTSAADSQGEDLRPERYASLATVVRAERADVEALTLRAAELQAEITRLSEGLDDAAVEQARQGVRRLEDPAGLRPRLGPGVRVTLSDSPPEVRDVSEQPPSLLVVHQQDIQAVVNALWRGGASAMTIQGQRVVTTTGIKCEGNSVLLHGVPYAQPYVIEAIGDQDALEAALAADRSVSLYRAQAEVPTIAIGWGLERAVVDAPAYEGLLDLGYAKPST